MNKRKQDLQEAPRLGCFCVSKKWLIATFSSFHSVYLSPRSQAANAATCDTPRGFIRFGAHVAEAGCKSRAAALDNPGFFDSLRPPLPGRFLHRKKPDAHPSRTTALPPTRMETAPFSPCVRRE